MKRVLIANRGEIAIRIARTARDLGLEVVAMHSSDEPHAPHAVDADRVIADDRPGPTAYLDAPHLVELALRHGADAIHPGYGFLSESADLAERCAAAGVRFVGAASDTLRIFGDKSRTRALAQDCEVPVLQATEGDTDVETAHRFATELGGGPVMVKALMGGGGRGIRVVENPTDRAVLAAAMSRCRAEAELGFGQGEVYVEQFLPRARHIEVQVVGDGRGQPRTLLDRDCTLQLRRQKIIEFAPAPDLADTTRIAMHSDAIRLAQAAGLRGLATMEFLLDTEDPGRYYFIEANPRLQVEHPVTEAISGIDLVALQFRIAQGEPLNCLGLDEITARGSAAEARISASAPESDTMVVTEALFPQPSATVRVDTYIAAGVRIPTTFDPLVAKVIAHAPDGTQSDATASLRIALADITIDGVSTNIEFLDAILGASAVRSGRATTTTVDTMLTEKGARASTPAPGRSARHQVIASPVAGVVTALDVQAGDLVLAGTVLAAVESMKMETDCTAAADGIVERVHAHIGDHVSAAAPLVTVRGLREGEQPTAGSAPVDTAPERHADLLANAERHFRTLDAARPQAVTRRRDKGKRTARENLADLFDDGVLQEYGALAIAAQRSRRTIEELERDTPADGVVCGFGKVAGVSVAAVAFDYTVLAGTQGLQGHRKLERIFELAARRRCPVVIYAEGGGGRPGDVDNLARATGMDLQTFTALGRLNGLVPTVAIASGRCFAGSAALVGMCDVVVATNDTNLALGGPAMIEGGGLGSFRPEDIGPFRTQIDNGVIDVPVDDEQAATAVAQHYIRLICEPARPGLEQPNQDDLRGIVPRRRNRPVDMRSVIKTLADVDSFLELRGGFAPGMITGIGTIEGTSIGFVANDAHHGGGAIGSTEADKAARFLQLCDSHRIPIVTLCDTPGFSVGPSAEETATVRHISRLLVMGPNLTVPLCTVIVRRAYGMGGQAMAGGSFRVPHAIVAWPTAELGAMGPEGAVRLGYRRELESIADPAERRRRFEHLVQHEQSRGRPHNAASVFEIDDVIDPAETRAWIRSSISDFKRDDHQSRVRRRIDTW